MKRLNPFYWIKWLFRPRFKNENLAIAWELENGYRDIFYFAVKGKMAEFKYSLLSEAAKKTTIQLFKQSVDNKEMQKHADYLNSIDPKQFRKMIEDK